MKTMFRQGILAITLLALCIAAVGQPASAMTTITMYSEITFQGQNACAWETFEDFCGPIGTGPAESLESCNSDPWGWMAFYLGETIATALTYIANALGVSVSLGCS